MKKSEMFSLPFSLVLLFTGCQPSPPPKAPADKAPMAGEEKMEDHSKMKMDQKDEMPAEVPAK